MSEAIDKKLLAGLKFRSSKPGKDGGFVPTERNLTPGDVLDWAENGSVVTIVTADGQKYKVDKNAKGKAPAENADPDKNE